MWSKRKLSNGTIGRVFTVHPSAGDKYYLRILLHHNFCKGKIVSYLGFLIDFLTYLFQERHHSLTYEVSTAAL